VLYFPNLGAVVSFRTEFITGCAKGLKADEVSPPQGRTPQELQAKLTWVGWSGAPPQTAQSQTTPLRRGPGPSTWRCGPRLARAASWITRPVGWCSGCRCE
jgi:hypothetical protein